MKISLGATLIAAAIGVSIGLLTGYRGGASSTVALRVTDVMLAFPSILLALFLVAVMGPSDGIVILALMILYIPGFLRFARAMAISLRERAFVEASVISGASSRHVIWKHLLPNAIGPLLVGIALTAAYTLLAAATLSYLGLGTPPPAPSWGSMLQASFNYVFQDWRYGIWPGLCIVTVALGYMLVSEGIEVAVQRSGSAGVGASAVEPTGAAAATGSRGDDVVSLPAVSGPPGVVREARGGVVLSIEDLVVDFPLGETTVRAVDGLSLTIRPGQRLGVVGESGSGKSTVAMAVLGLLEPPGTISGGSITLGDLELSNADDDVLRRVRGGRISMVFQDALGSLNPVKSIGYQLTEAIRLHTEREQGGGRRPGGRAPGRGRSADASSASRAVPARVLRRDAPARDDRDGTRVAIRSC